jgi:phage host-nuclease inhibitor protein Gam
VTTEERLDRIEHVTAGFAEQFRKDREENRQLWRATQRQIGELADEMREADWRLGDRIELLAEESCAADKRLGERIDQLAGRVDSLVSAIGSLINSGKRPESL